jgi:hypothetical protein
MTQPPHDEKEIISKYAGQTLSSPNFNVSAYISNEPDNNGDYIVKFSCINEGNLYCDVNPNEDIAKIYTLVMRLSNFTQSKFQSFFASVESYCRVERY